jgi:hypothetical protein
VWSRKPYISGNILLRDWFSLAVIITIKFHLKFAFKENLTIIEIFFFKQTWTTAWVKMWTLNQENAQHWWQLPICNAHIHPHWNYPSALQLSICMAWIVHPHYLQLSTGTAIIHYLCAQNYACTDTCMKTWDYFWDSWWDRYSSRCQQERGYKGDCLHSLRTLTAQQQHKTQEAAWLQVQVCNRLALNKTLTWEHFKNLLEHSGAMSIILRKMCVYRSVPQCTA